MSTNKPEGNKSGGNDVPLDNLGANTGDDKQYEGCVKNKEGQWIRMLQRRKEGDDKPQMNKCLNLFLCFCALCLLYGYYILFGWAWLTAMEELGEDLNWAFLGLMVAVGGGMMGGVAYSMKAQQTGWWAPLTAEQRKARRNAKGIRRCSCCGVQIY